MHTCRPLKPRLRHWDPITSSCSRHSVLLSGAMNTTRENPPDPAGQSERLDASKAEQPQAPVRGSDLRTQNSAPTRQTTGAAPPVAQGARRSPPSLAVSAQRQGESFSATRVWIFDLDNTLYPAECNLFAQVDRRMGEFIARELGVPFEHARHLQKSYYHQFGTTLAGLMQVHKMAPEPFLDYVHDIDVSVVPDAPDLRTALARLPGRKLIFTNGSRAHAERVAGKLGVLDVFEDISDIASCGYEPKPSRGAFDAMIARHGVAAREAAMFEDLPQNLEVPHDLGMATVLVWSSYIDHPVHRSMRSWTEPPAHIHHTTDDLVTFLDGIEAPYLDGSDEG